MSKRGQKLKYRKHITGGRIPKTKDTARRRRKIERRKLLTDNNTAEKTTPGPVGLSIDEIFTKDNFARKVLSGRLPKDTIEKYLADQKKEQSGKEETSKTDSLVTEELINSSSSEGQSPLLKETKPF